MIGSARDAAARTLACRHAIVPNSANEFEIRREICGASGKSCDIAYPFNAIGKDKAMAICRQNVLETGSSPPSTGCNCLCCSQILIRSALTICSCSKDGAQAAQLVEMAEQGRVWRIGDQVLEFGKLGPMRCDRTATGKLIDDDIEMNVTFPSA